MPNQIYFIDSKLNDYQTIVNSLSSTDIYYIIDSSSDGLSQMSNILSNYSNLDSIHVYSHGDIGSLNLGNKIYDNTNIDNYKVELENIGKSLTPTGDILLYGCNVGQDEIGLNFINQIAEFSQADVAASDDLTGNSNLGGDWDLEVSSGVVETNTLEVKDYQSVMLDDHSDTTVGATALTLGTAKEGNIVINGDVDYFKVDLVKGQKYVFDMRKGTLSQLQLDLYNDTSNISLKTSSEPYNSAAQFLYIAENTATYYLKASEYGNNGTGTYTLKTFVDDNKGTKEGATALTLGTVKEGNIVINGDVDYFKVDLIAGGKYTFEMKKGTLSQLQLELYNKSSDIALKKTYAPTGGVTQFIYVAETTGTYYLKASEYGNNGKGTYIVKAYKDLVNISKSISYILLQFEDNLTLTGTSAINGTGNTLNNTITGNSANNILNGKAGNDTLKGGLGNDTLYGELGNDILNGEAGVDIMLGGAGNDIYYVDNALDKVYETTTTTSTIDATGIDIVNSSISYTLTSFVENLTLTGTSAINGTGNTLNNTITGNSVANTLNGGLGNDILKGGLGNDTLIGAFGNDILYGETGNDILNGGVGNDTLYGGIGLDKFVFNTTLNPTTNKDVIKDFSVIDDTIVLENAIFTKLTSTTFNSITKVLNTGNFVSTTDGKAKDANDYLVYNKGTGQLFYDVDGNGAGAAIQFATIENKASLTYADFTVI